MTLSSVDPWLRVYTSRNLFTFMPGFFGIN